MIKCDLKELVYFEGKCPGFIATVLRFDSRSLPPCWHCESTDTAAVQCGMVSLTISLASVSTKFHLLPNYNGEGIYFCNSCGKQFGPEEFNHDTGEE